MGSFWGRGNRFHSRCEERRSTQPDGDGLGQRGTLVFLDEVAGWSELGMGLAGGAGGPLGDGGLSSLVWG